MKDGRRTPVVEDSRYDRYRPPEVRRRIVVLTLVVFGLEVVAAAGGLAVGIAFDQLVAVPVGALLAVVLLLAQLLMITRLKGATRGVSDTEDDLLDERQMHVRGQVYTRAYHVGLSTVGLLALLPVAWSLAGGLHVDLDGWETTVLLLPVLLAFQLMAMTPTLVAARHGQA
jgi:hypothetical protein